MCSFPDIDPCEEGRQRCGPNSGCVVEQESYRCVCNPGYQAIYVDEQHQCVDINECQIGLHDCDFNAECHNEIGTYSCSCLPGFTGDGKVCVNAMTCSGIVCQENAECIEDGVAR